MQVNCIFKRIGDPEEWSTVLVRGTSAGANELQAGATTPPIVVRAPQGYTGTQSWSRYDQVLAGTAATFGPVRDRRALEVQPKRIDVVSLPSAMTLQEFHQRYPSTVDLSTVAIINQADASTRFPAGAEVKRVVGGELPPERGR